MPFSLETAFNAKTPSGKDAKNREMARGRQSRKTYFRLTSWWVGSRAKVELPGTWFFVRPLVLDATRVKKDCFSPD
jgi:hypothetical protein